MLLEQQRSETLEELLGRVFGEIDGLVAGLTMVIEFEGRDLSRRELPPLDQSMGRRAE